ncbi:hypothetical protein HK098_000658 [Nowakowskiella sp. JEL0407]|nr:hypothetical protein HK098_000658 [Nowakowskiella sp. JEL0407]
MGLDRPYHIPEQQQPHQQSQSQQLSSQIYVEDSHLGSGQRAPPYWQFLLMSSCAGALAGVTSAVLTNPMDVVKTRLQTNIRNAERNESGRKVGGTRRVGSIRMIFNEFLLLYREEGLNGFKRGVGARAANTVPVSMLMVTSYELVRRLSTM